MGFRGEGTVLEAARSFKIRAQTGSLGKTYWAHSQPKRPHVERPGSSESSREIDCSYLKVDVIRAFVQQGLWGIGQVVASQCP